MQQTVETLRYHLENSSFIVSSEHDDASLHGQGFVARLSGSTAELLHMWLLMNLGLKPFRLNANNELNLVLEPILPNWLFTKAPSTIILKNQNGWQNVDLPKNIYAFKLLNSTLVVYHNQALRSTYGKNAVAVNRIQITYTDRSKPVELNSKTIPAPYAKDIRDGKVERIDAYLT